MNFGKLAGIAALLCSCTLGAGASGPNGELEHIPSFERSVMMQGPGCQNVKWTVDREASTITFLVESAEGADWVGFGISENGGMKGADVAIIRKTAADSLLPQIVVDDRVSVDYVIPTKDSLQNVELLYSELREADQRIVAVIQRNLKTCDKEDLTVEAHKQHLICASGLIDPDYKILFHGPNHAHALVNLVVDEDLLFETSLSIENEYSSSTPLALGVNAWGDPKSSVVPFPLDIQMQNVSLPMVTSYICAPVNIPFDARFIQAESVWGDGLTLKDSEPLPPYLHHQTLYSCPDHLFQDDFDSIEPLPCLEMPSCERVLGLVRGTSGVMPSGIHMKIKAGKHILQAHYTNYAGVAANNDRSGIRLWIEPPLIPSRSAQGQTFRSIAQLSSIIIPADPEEKDYSIQFMIPGDATKEYIPPEGLQAIAAIPHMHTRGIRARLQLIRDGFHILDVFNTLSYDLNMQVLLYKGWKLLPGDSLLMTCTYRPHPMHIVKGGFTSESEMCAFGITFAQKIPAGAINGVGYAVKEGQPLKKAFLGLVPYIYGADVFTLDPSWATFAPQENEEHFKSIIDHRLNVCELMVRDSLNAPVYTFSEYNITAMLTMIIAYAFCCIMSLKPVSKRVFGANCDERTRRNSIVYIGQLIYGSIGLPIVVIALVEINSTNGTFDAVHPNTYSLARGVMLVQGLLFLIELFYRLSIRTEVVVHHALSVSFGIVLYFAVSQTLAAEFLLKLCLVMTLMALTDHPLNLALLLKNLGYAETSWWPKLFVLCKMAVIGMSIAVLVDGNDVNGTMWSVPNYSFSSWRNNESKLDTTAVTIFEALLLIGLFTVQTFVGYVMWTLGSKYEKMKIDSAVPVSDEKQNFQHQSTISLSHHQSFSSD